MVKEKITGFKFGKMQIGYKTLITVMGMLIAAWLLTKNLCCDADGIKWIPTQDIKIDLKK